MTKGEIEQAIRCAQNMADGGEFERVSLVSRALLHIHALTTAPLPEELAEIEARHRGDPVCDDCDHGPGDTRRHDPSVCPRGAGTRADVPRLLAGMRAQAAEIVALRAELAAAMGATRENINANWVGP